jgi:hypothetical protein
MTKKLGPIAKDKEKDIQLCRQELLDIISNIDTATANATALKVKVEAIKSLGRFHHALQVEKVTAKADAKAGAQVQQLPPDVKARVDKEIDAILGRGTEIQDTPVMS